MSKSARAINSDDARQLALLMVEIGTDAGRDMIAVISTNQPLGEAVGTLEVAEAIVVMGAAAVSANTVWNWPGICCG
jgi:thymidine phosphorylase